MQYSGSHGTMKYIWNARKVQEKLLETSSIILIADDSPAIQQTLKALLNDDHYQLAFASDGAEALEKATELLPDLVLLDLVMPEMDGFEVCRRMRMTPHLAEVPIIMITGMHDREARLKGLEIGADDFVSKPFDKVELHMRVRSITRLNRYRRLLAERARFRQLIELSPDSILIVDAEHTIRLANSTMARMLQATDEHAILGQNFLFFVDNARAHECAISLNHILSSPYENTRFETTLKPLGGGSIHVEINAGHLVWNKQPMIQIIARDITGWKQTTRELQQAHQAAAERAARFRLLVEVGSDLISTHSLNDLLHLALQRATVFSGYDSGSILLFVQPEDILEVRASIGKDAIAPGTRVDNLDRSISGRVIQEQQPLVLEGHGEAIGTEWRMYTKAIPSTVNLPLITSNGKTIGILSLKCTAQPRTLNADDLETLQLLASQLAVTVENSRLHEENARLLKELEKREVALLELVERLMLSQEEERRRIAYELHDSLAQIAASAHQHLQTFASRYHPRTQQRREELERALDLTQRVVKETRLVIGGLRPTVLDDFGLASALRHEVNNMRTEQWEITYEESVDSQRLPPAIETAFFRVAQEALNNIRKHAGKTPIHISLQVHEKTIRLEVRDWGRGFEPGQRPGKAASGEHIGLLSMQERVAMLGGTFHIESHSGEGTVVIAEAPFANLQERRKQD